MNPGGSHLEQQINHEHQTRSDHAASGPYTSPIHPNNVSESISAPSASSSNLLGYTPVDMFDPRSVQNSYQQEDQPPEVLFIDVTRITDDTVIDIKQLDGNAFLIDLHMVEDLEDEFQRD